jgi:hypothetical protein
MGIRFILPKDKNPEALKKIGPDLFQTLFFSVFRHFASVQKQAETSTDSTKNREEVPKWAQAQAKLLEGYSPPLVNKGLNLLLTNHTLEKARWLEQIRQSNRS